MNQKELIDFFDKTVIAMRATLIAKNSDYTGALEGDAFANFTRVESLGIASTEAGMLTRMLDKMMRLASFVKKGTLAVKNESATDTALDLAVYSILFAGWALDKAKAVTTAGTGAK